MNRHETDYTYRQLFVDKRYEVARMSAGGTVVDGIGKGAS